MRINLTFIIQLCNILLTLWFLRSFFWKRLLGYVFEEQHTRDILSQSCAALEKEIEENKIAILNEQQALTKTLQAKLQQLETPLHHVPTPAQTQTSAQIAEADKTVVEQGVQKIAALLDKKF